ATSLDEPFETLQLKNRIAELERQLKDAELRAIAFSTMVDIAEKEFKIPIPLFIFGAERINGINKDEYLETYDIENIKQAKELLKQVVDLYNGERPHMSISNFTPNQIHHATTQIKTEKLWKNYYRKQSTIVNSLQD
ncbi:MAG: hypothetical protein EXR21_10080, partial [Flavobacteriaceae bacterium]|nr:hypothetical protein [Flavobacteriaceae bacterium]